MSNDCIASIKWLYHNLTSKACIFLDTEVVSSFFFYIINNIVMNNLSFKSVNALLIISLRSIPRIGITNVKGIGTYTFVTFC